MVDIPVAMHTQVMGDPTRLRQILVNLLGNAVKFTHEGHVQVAVRPVKETVEQITLNFEIQDTGVGIPEAKLDSIFDSFTQANSSTTREYGGSGLGTTIAEWHHEPQSMPDDVPALMVVHLANHIASTVGYGSSGEEAPADANTAVSGVFLKIPDPTIQEIQEQVGKKMEAMQKGLG